MSFLNIILKKSLLSALMLFLALNLVIAGCGGKGSMEGGTSEDSNVGQVKEEETLEEELFEEELFEEEDEGAESASAEEEYDEEESKETAASSDEAEDSSEEMEVSQVDTYTVQPNDTLWTIAAKKEVYGSGWLYPLIYKANKELLRNPNNLKTGTELNIPRGLSQAQQEAAKEEAMADEYLTAKTSTDPGAIVETEMVDNADSNYTEAAKVPATQAVPTAIGAAPQPEPVRQKRKPQKEGGSGTLVAVIVLVLAGAGGAFFYLKKKREGEEMDKEEEDV